MESISSDSNSSMFASPDSVVELPNAGKFETSVSVSSLAEKFEKSGDFSRSEDKCTAECKMDGSHLVPENNLVNKSVVSETNGSALEVIVKDNKLISCHEVVSCSSDISKPSAAELKNLNSVSQGGAEISTELQNTDAIEERVSFFANKISEASQNAVSGAKSDSNQIPEGIAQACSIEPAKNIEGNSSNFSLKHLEQSFINALNIVNGEHEQADTADTLLVPSIQITEASDREDNSSEDLEKTIPKSRIVETELEGGTEGEVEATSDVSPEERKATFYISSSDLPTEHPQISAENSNELQESYQNVDELADSTRTQETNSSRISCLYSKSCHGITFLGAFVLATLGCILYGFAHQGKVPDYCEYLGLTIAILAGMVGAFSCFCYSCLEIFPGPSRAGYERIPETSYIASLPPQNENENAGAQSMDDSWSSEKERAFRIQNGMSSTRTSATSLRSDLGEYLVIKKSEHRKLVDKTEQLNKGLMELLDSFSTFTCKLEPMDKLVEMESGIRNDNYPGTRL